jgi:hypothetical protein
MNIEEVREFINELKQIDGPNALVLFKTVRMLVACSKNDSDIGAVMVVRTPAEDENAWALHIHSFNLDLDDAYIALDKASNQLAEHIQAEAPLHGHYN